jgi:hydroxymethylpyrimidine pyrophosphatase-like HAD family hydrolase
VKSGLDKVCGSDALLKRLGISYEETMAIGDSISDLGIIKTCGLGIAMGNASEYVRAQADAVTARNEEDGLALAFEKYVL